MWYTRYFLDIIPFKYDKNKKKHSASYNSYSTEEKSKAQKDEIIYSEWLSGT